MNTPTLNELLAQSSAMHRHLCPRQVLGVRMGIFAARLLDVPAPQEDKRILAIVETDGCFSDGLSVALNCWVGRRTLRVQDYGKVAATVIDSQTERAIRFAIHPDARTTARDYADNARNKWEAMLQGYQAMPAEQLLTWQEVRLAVPVRVLISRPGMRVTCEECGEEILNERQVNQAGRTLCRSCAGDAYYTAAQFQPVVVSNGYV